MKIGTTRVSVNLNRRPILSVTESGMSMGLSVIRPQPAAASKPRGNDVVSENRLGRHCCFQPGQTSVPLGLPWNPVVHAGLVTEWPIQSYAVGVEGQGLACVLLSGYPHASHDAALPGWRRIEKATHADGALPRVEALWLNPVAIAGLGQGRLL